MADRRYVTRSELVTNLTHLGLGEGATVMPQASVKSIGWVVGGTDVVLQSLLDDGAAGRSLPIWGFETVSRPYDLGLSR